MTDQAGSNAYNKVPTHFIWAGDFNCHHKMWDKPCNHHLFTNTNIMVAKELINLVAEHGLQMVLPPGIMTLQSFATKNWMQGDNVFTSNTFTD